MEPHRVFDRLLMLTFECVLQQEPHTRRGRHGAQIAIIDAFVADAAHQASQHRAVFFGDVDVEPCWHRQFFTPLTACRKNANMKASMQYVN